MRSIKTTVLGVLTAGAVLAAMPLTAQAQKETIDWTAVVTSSNEAGILIGETVTGSWTINLNHDTPALSENGINYSTPWNRTYEPGYYVGSPTNGSECIVVQYCPPNEKNVFAQTARIGGVTFKDGTTNGATLANGFGGPGTIYGPTVEYASDASGSGFVATSYNLNGAPNVTGDTVTGQIGVNGTSEINYAVTSMSLATPRGKAEAPELDSASLAGAMTLLVGLTVVMRGRRGLRG